MIQPHLPVRLPCSRSPHVAMERGLYLHPVSNRRSLIPRAFHPGARRSVSEGSTHQMRVPMCDFPADCPHPTHFHCLKKRRVARDTRSFQQQAEFFSDRHRSGSQLTYDFTPIADPTFDGSLPRVGPPASGVTHFRGVTGGVYKTRERIHRSVADLRLLATPTSCSRVADCNPNQARFSGIRSTSRYRCPL